MTLTRDWQVKMLNIAYFMASAFRGGYEYVLYYYACTHATR